MGVVDFPVFIKYLNVQFICKATYTHIYIYQFLYFYSKILLGARVT